MVTQVVTINNTSTVMAANEATTPANTFKTCVLTQGSHLLKAAEPSSFLSSAAVSSNSYPWMTGNQKKLMQAHVVVPSESPVPCDQKQLNGSLDSAFSAAPGKDGKIIKENNLKSAKKCHDSSGNEFVGDSRLRNDGDVASPRGSTGIEDSFVETASANQFYKREENSSKRQRLEPTLLHGAVAQSGETLHDHGLNTSRTLQDSETNMVETENHGTKSILTKEKLEEKKGKVKESKRESALRAKLRKQVQQLNTYRGMTGYISWFHSGSISESWAIRDKIEELEKLREKAEKLKRKNFKLKKKIMQISEECQEVNEENDSLMDEAVETHGPDAISDIRSRNPASVNSESNSYGERTLSDNNSTDDQK